MDYLFDENIKNILHRSGWQEDRLINESKYLTEWKKEGYSVDVKTIEFIKSFGGLKIQHESYKPGNQPDESKFSPDIALGIIFYGRVCDDYQKRIKMNLCPVGVGFSEHLIYLMSSSGGIYGGYDDYFCLIGSNVEIAFANIFFEHNFKEII